MPSVLHVSFIKTLHFPIATLDLGVNEREGVPTHEMVMVSSPTCNVLLIAHMVWLSAIEQIDQSALPKGHNMNPPFIYK